MGNILNTEYIDTVEVFLIETGATEADFKFVDYAKFIRQQKEIYGTEKGLNRHHTMRDYIVHDFADFSRWIISRHKNTHQALGSQK